MITDTLPIVSAEVREAEERANMTPTLRSHHNRLVKNAKQLAALAIELAALFERMSVPPEPDVYENHGETAWLLEAYTDYARCLFKNMRPIMEMIEENARDYGAANVESYGFVEAAVTDFLGPLVKAAEELKEASAEARARGR